MIETDLSFEYSEVEASISGEIVSVKNVLSGTVVADKVNDIIIEEGPYQINGKVIIRK